MSEDIVLERLLQRISQGDLDAIEELLVHLADFSLSVPAVEVTDIADPRGTSKVKLVTFTQDGKKLVPCFTSHEKFERWSSAKYEKFAVTGADLSLTLPADVWLLINPGQPSTLEISPEQLRHIGQIDVSAFSSAWQQTSQIDLADEILDISDTGEFSSPSIFSEDRGSNGNAEGRQRVNVDPTVVATALESIFYEFSEVEEAYLQTELESSWAQAVVGLLTSELDAERRFLIIDRIAELSRRLYGFAGAIEVYDDLDVRASRSWELFNALAPIYVRGDFVELQDNLAQYIEVTEGPAVNRRPYENLKPSEANLDWGNVRRTGSKILGALRGVLRG